MGQGALPSCILVGWLKRTKNHQGWIHTRWMGFCGCYQGGRGKGKGGRGPSMVGHIASLVSRFYYRLEKTTFRDIKIRVDPSLPFPSLPFPSFLPFLPSLPSFLPSFPWEGKGRFRMTSFLTFLPITLQSITISSFVQQRSSLGNKRVLW